MFHSPEERSAHEELQPQALRSWLDELMLHHGLSQGERDRALEKVDLLPKDDKLSNVLKSDESHNYKLGFVAGQFLNWRDANKLPPGLLAVANIIEGKAKELGIE